jgi:hypothetical protein
VPGRLRVANAKRKIRFETFEQCAKPLIRDPKIIRERLLTTRGSEPLPRLRKKTKKHSPLRGGVKKENRKGLDDKLEPDFT